MAKPLTTQFLDFGTGERFQSGGSFGWLLRNTCGIPIRPVSLKALFRRVGERVRICALFTFH